MSGYTSGNNAPTLMTQNANRVGNASTRVASHDKGVTAITSGSGGLKQPSGNQGAPKFAPATSNTKSGATSGRGQKVMVDRPKAYETCSTNCGYIKGSSYLK